MMRARFTVVMLVFALAPLVAASSGRPAVRAQAGSPWDTGTFSILGYDPETGAVGGAVQSRVFSVGNGVLWAEAGVGAVATQAIVDVSYGPQALELLRQGLAPKDIITTIWNRDPDPRPATGPGENQVNWSKDGRQFAVINAKGEVAAYTGPRAPLERGDAQGAYCTAQGNTLGGKDVPAAMVAAFEKTEKDASGNRNHLSLRLLAAIEAGQAAGGDRRGQQSAAMIVVKKGCGVWLNNDVELRLQVDDNPAPITELRRLVEYWNAHQKRRGC
jgi:uncharacterized Ntn-hydrolase superfamily protein